MGVARQAAAGDDGMHVRMMVQVLPPGVQHHQARRPGHRDAWDWPPPPAAWPTPTGRAGRRVPTRLARANSADFGRQGEDHVIVLDRQQVLGLLVQPWARAKSLALGTVAVATGVVGDAVVAAVQAMLDVAAQAPRCGNAARSRKALRLRARQVPPCRARNASPYCRITSATSNAGRSRRRRS